MTLSLKNIFLMFAVVLLPHTVIAQIAGWQEGELLPTKSDVRQRTVNIGVMLPLDNTSADGKRMAEYYRGILMACDSLRKEGISTDIKAWNTGKNSNINALLGTPGVADLDIVFGPMYAEHVGAMADFARNNGIKLLVPFNVNTTVGETNEATFLASAPDSVYNGLVAAQFVNMFDTCHVVIVECNDSQDMPKSQFARELRSNLNLSPGGSCSTVSLNADESVLASAFKSNKGNMVVLNTTSSQNLNIAFAKLNALSINNPELRISLFGHTEWIMYSNQFLGSFYRYNTFIPSTFFMNPLSARTEEINMKYLQNFNDDMANTLPRMAICGFDHAYFFIKGLKKMGSEFDGHSADVRYTPIQSPLNFQKNDNGTNINMSIMFVNYTPEYNIETYTY